MYQRLFSIAILASLSLSACNTTLPISDHLQQSTQEQNLVDTKGVFYSAQYKRTLQLANIQGKVVPLARITKTPQSQDFKTLQIATTIAIAEPAMARSVEPYFYYGGHDFNQYTIQYAEENFYPAAKGSSLLEVYKNSIQPILAEWDKEGRLVESRAQINGDEIEYVHLPNSEGEPLKLKPNYVFRFASSPRKETINIYVMDKETRVHRMVWGEPDINIDQVKIDSDQALSIAEKAFANKSKDPGYPVYPDFREQNTEVIYDLPDNLHWQLHLNQQSQKEMRYFLSFNFVKKGNVYLKPMNQPMPEPSPYDGDPDLVDSNDSTQAEIMPDRYYEQYLNGFIEIDAITGKVKSMNRPVLYPQYYDDYGYGEGIAPPGVPVEVMAGGPVTSTNSERIQ